MYSGKSEPAAPPVLSAEAARQLTEGVSLILSRWTALQMAVEGGWGGRNSRQKALDLESDIVSFFSVSKDDLYIDDLEKIIDETMAISFNSEIEDGSIAEVAEKLMIIHEECLEGNYASIERLRMSNHSSHAVSQSQRMINDDDDESSDDDDEDASDMMMVDELKPKYAATDEMKSIPKQIVDGDGWSVVSSRKNKGKKTG